MKEHVLLPLCTSLALVVASVFLPAQTDSGQGDLIAAENTWVAAELHHDSASLSRLMSDDLVMTETDGSVIDKGQEIAFAGNSNARLEVLETHDMKVHIHGDTAVVVGAFHEKGIYHSQ